MVTFILMKAVNEKYVLLFFDMSIQNSIYSIFFFCINMSLAEKLKSDKNDIYVKRTVRASKNRVKSFCLICIREVSK